jgi:VCBS repeat-containing protein
VTDTDAAGNSKSADFAFTLDTQIAQPTISLVSDSTDGATGHAGDGVTNNANLNISAAEVGTTRVITVDGQVVSSYDPAALKDGGHTVNVTDTDVAGNSKSADFAFTLDTVASVSISINSIGNDLITAAQVTAGGNVTVTGTVGGDAKVNDVVTVTVNGHETTGVVTQGSNGLVFSAQVAVADLVADKTIDAKITATDAAGNTFTSTAQHTVSGESVAGNDARSVTEDLAPTPADGLLTTSGAVTVVSSAGLANAVDPATTVLVTHTVTSNGVTNGTPALGTLTVHADGTYDFNVSNSAVQFLGQGDKIVQTYEVKTADGTATSTITITINGTNDVPTFSAGAGQDAGGVTEDATTPLLSTTGTLVVSDADNGQSGIDIGVSPVSSAGALGSISINAQGQWTYSVDNSKVQYLAADETKVETFTVKSLDGTSHDISVTITGTNDAAVIAAPVANLTETDAVLTTGGTLHITDVDSALTFAPLSDVAGSNGYGKFSVSASGDWTYTTNTAHNEFVAGQTYTDTVTVTSADGTTSSITVNILGTNDAAVIVAPVVNLTEADAVLTTGGTLHITDVDSALTFAPLSDVAGSNGYGKFSVSAGGDWTYTTNTAHNEFVAGKTYTDTVTVTSADGTTSSITVNILGTNDVPVIGGVSTGVVQEDTAVLSNHLNSSGVLSISDADLGQSNFAPQSSVAGTYGTFTLAADGHWTYTADNTQTAIQQLGATQFIKDSFTAVSSDGTAHQLVTVTINGTNDVPVISGVSTGVVQEDTAVLSNHLNTSGVLSIADADLGQSNFAPQTSAAGTFGTFTLTADGHWSYTADNTQTAIQQLGATQSIKDSFTAVSSDGTASQVVTVTINGTNDVPTITTDSGNAGNAHDVVSEALLAGGTHQGGGSLVATGTFTVADADGLSNIKSVSIDGVALAAGHNYDGAHGTLHIDSYAGGVASYTYTLTSAIHGATSNDGTGTVINGETFALQVTDNSDATATASIAIDVKDDVPLAAANPVSVSVSEGGYHVVGNDVVLIIDRSGSMAGSELTNLKASIKTMFDSGSVHSVFITSFSDTATFYNSGSNGGWFTNLTDAMKAVNAIQASGSTDYDLALKTVTTHFTPPPAGGEQLVSVFISDGQPNTASDKSTPGIVDAEETNWYNFLQDKGFSNSYAVGFSGLTAADKGYLEPIAWHAPEVASTYSGAADPNVMVVAQASDVANALLTLVSLSHTVTGNVLSGELGADQPFTLVSVTVGSTSYTFDGTHLSYTIDTGNGGLTIKSNGDYAFTGVSSVGSTGQAVALAYTISDADGDLASRALNLTVTDGVPTAVADSAAATEGHWKLATGNSVDTISYVVPGHWSDVAAVTQPSIGSSSVANPASGGVPLPAITSNFAVVADALHTASISVGLTLSGFSNGADTMSVALFDASHTQVGLAQSISASATVTFTGIAASGSYYVQATGTERNGNSDGNFKFNFNSGSANVTSYSYTPDAIASTTIATPDVAWVAGAASTGNVLTNDLAGTNGGLHLTAVDAGSITTAVTSTAGVDVVGSYGTLHIGSNGAYTYTPGSGDFQAGATDHFTYTVADANGHASTAVLAVALNNFTYTNSGTSNLVAGTDGDDNLVGLGGHQVLYGSWGNDTLTGVGNDRLIGGAGDDHLIAGAGGSNVLIGGAGNDVMTGSAAGADVFKWTLADQGVVGAPAIDHITNFNAASIPNGGDVLDLKDLLQGEHSAAVMGVAATGSLDQYLNFEVLGGKLTLDVHDPLGANHITQKIVLDNVSGTLDAARDSLAHTLGMTGSHISDADLLKKLVDTGHLKTDA